MMMCVGLLLLAAPEIARIEGTDADPAPDRIEVPEGEQLELAVAGLGLVRASSGARLLWEDGRLRLVGGRVWVLAGARGELDWYGLRVRLAPGTSAVLQASPPVVAVASGSAGWDEVEVGPGQVWAAQLEPGGEGLLASVRMEWQDQRGWLLDRLPVPVTPPGRPEEGVLWGERELFGHPSDTSPLLERALVPEPRVEGP